MNAGYSVGSAAAGVIAQLQALEAREDFDAYRTIDLINMGAHGAALASDIMAANPAEARACLIHGASRLLAAADRLEGVRVGTRNVHPIRAVS